MRYRIAHKTDYRYANSVPQSNHLVHLSPRQTKGQTLESHDIVISPLPAQKREFVDYFGNPTIHLTIEEDHNILSVEAKSIVTVERDHATALKQSSTAWETVRDAMLQSAHATEAEFSCYSGFTHPTAEIAAYGVKSFSPGRPLLQAVSELTTRIYEDFDYDGTVTDVSTPVTRVFEIKGGVCQDFAHLQLCCLRALGLPARYVSGYLRTYPPEGQPRLIGADASHAWISVWCPQAGWVDFDPTNNKMITEEHITLTVGRDFNDVSPISGIILGGGSHFVDVSVDVMPIDIKGNEIGGTTATQSQQSGSQDVSLPISGEKSQRANPERLQEQTQNQQTEQSVPLQPVPADRTY